MDQSKKKAVKVDQFMYDGRWVDRANFRAYVYDRAGKSKLANSYAEFEDLTTSGIWFASKPEATPIAPKKEKQNGAIRAAGE